MKLLQKITGLFKSIPTYMLCGIVVAILILLGIYLYRSPSSLKSRKTESFTDLATPSSFMMFYTDWCPHCTHAKPEFKKIMDNCSSGELNGKKIVVKMINAEENKDMAREYKVEGYPTLIFTKDGKNYTYEGNRTEKDMMSYLETMLRY
jgi:thiol-disulfide isomerase/thioredoxin